MLDSAGLPVVGGVDALLVTMCAESPKIAYIAALWAVAGSVAGSLLLYFIARKGGEVFLNKHVAKGTGARLHLWFQRYGLITVFVPAISPLPLPMKVPVFCAGALQVRTAYFLAVVSLARVIRYFALAYLASHYGHQTFQFLASHAILVGCIALALAVAAAVGLRLYQRQHPEKDLPE